MVRLRSPRGRAGSKEQQGAKSNCALGSILSALCPLLLAFYLAAMSHLKFISGLLLIYLLVTGCKNGSVEKGKEIETGQKDTTNLSKVIPAISDPVYVSKDSGYTWQPFDIKLPELTQANHIAQLGDELVISSKDNGLFITENHHASLKDISNGLATKKINTLYVNGNELYIGLSHEGVTRWVMGSAYWNSFNANLTNKNIIAIVKYKDELILGNDIGIFKSSGHMQTWTGKHFSEKVFSLAAHGDTILAGTQKGVMISIDGGEKWKHANTLGPVYAITILGKYVYAQYTSGDLYISENGGNSWRPVDYGPNDQSPVYTIIKAGDQYLLSSRKGVFSSRNGRTGWKSIPQQNHLTFIDFTMKDGVLYGVVKSEE